MKKILVALLAISATSAFALTDNSDFQAFDNEANVGFGISDNHVKVGNGASLDGTPYTGVQQSGLVNLEAEHLFNSGIWLDGVANMNFMQGSGAANDSQYGMNGKVGYAFTFNRHLQVTPYLTAGLNNNPGMVMDAAGNSATANTPVSNAYFLTGGIGARIEYRIINSLLVYADQDAVYNKDQTQYSMGGLAQNNYQETSTLGLKYNVVDNFQLGLKGFYNNFQYQTTGAANNALQVENGFGAMVTAGFTY